MKRVILTPEDRKSSYSAVYTYEPDEEFPHHIFDGVEEVYLTNEEFEKLCTLDPNKSSVENVRQVKP